MLPKRRSYVEAQNIEIHLVYIYIYIADYDNKSVLGNIKEKTNISRIKFDNENKMKYN